MDDSVDVGRIRRPRIDHGDVAAAQNIRAGAVEGKRAGVLGDDAPNAGRDLGHFTVGELQIASIRYVHAHKAKNNPSP